MNRMTDQEINERIAILLGVPYKIGHDWTHDLNLCFDELDPDANRRGWKLIIHTSIRSQPVALYQKEAEFPDVPPSSLWFGSARLARSICLAFMWTYGDNIQGGDE